MRTLSLKLFNRKNRPSFSYSVDKMDIYTLFDSGAETPVWCAGKDLFEATYQNAVKKEGVCKIYGFGKEYEEALVYMIPTFELADKDNIYKINNLYVAVCDRPQLGYDFIISDTMFSKADTFIYRREDKRLEIVFDRDEYTCVPKRTNDSLSITIFSQ